MPRVQLGSLAVAVEEILGLGDEQRAAIGDAAAEHVRKQFNAEIEAEALRDIIGLLLRV